MKNTYLLPLLAFVAFFNASCIRLYSPAMYHQDVAYMPKPASFDKESEATYISAGLNTYTNSSFNDAVVSGQLNLSQGFVFDNVNFAYGAFAAFGDYQNGQTDSKQASYSEINSSEQLAPEHLSILLFITTGPISDSLVLRLPLRMSMAIMPVTAVCCKGRAGFTSIRVLTCSV